MQHQPHSRHMFPVGVWREDIASQLMESGVELLVGGGRATFVAEEHGGDREDGRNLMAEARDRNWTVVTEKEEFLSASSTPALALFTDSHMAYEIDRDEMLEPSIAEMTLKALELLSNSEDGRENGFFLMIEGSRIDHAGHGNDPAGHLHDILAYDEAVAAVLAYARRDGNTLVISTADHETGGMSLGRDGVYEWNPEYLMSVRGSFSSMGDRVMAGESLLDVVEETVADDLTEEEASELELAFAEMNTDRLGELVRDIVSTRAGIGWTTTGHTAVDVGLYSFGPGSELFRRLYGKR